MAGVKLYYIKHLFTKGCVFWKVLLSLKVLFTLLSKDSACLLENNLCTVHCSCGYNVPDFILLILRLVQSMVDKKAC